MKNHLKINAEMASRQIEDYIKEHVESNGQDGLLLGLSGGVDSVVLASLGVRGLGKERVKAYFLPDRDTSPESHGMAKKASGWLGIEMIKKSIAPAMARQNVYGPGIMRISAYSCIINLTSPFALFQTDPMQEIGC